ncbi:MAG: phosphatase PAP2 family protein [Bacteroidota bacterium]
MKTLILLLGLFGLSHSVAAQYSPNTPTELTLLGSGIALTGGGLLFLNDFPPISDETIQQLYTEPRHRFPLSIDRWATKQSSRPARNISDALVASSLIPPLVLLFNRPTANDDRGTQSLMTLQSFVLNMGITSFTKRVVRRPRPFMYNNDLATFPMEQRRDRKARMSFFSGHTSTTAAMYFLTAQTFSTYYPDSPWRPWVWTASVSIPALTGFLRVKAGKHFPTDVLVGYIVGALVGGVLVPALH